MGDPLEEELLKYHGLLITTGRHFIKWDPKSRHTLIRAVNDLIDTARREGKYQAAAKSLLHKTNWSYIENDRAFREGWYLGFKDIRITRSLPEMTMRFRSSEEAHEFVKQEAARGDVLAEKAITEIARRIFRGISSNEHGSA